MAEIYWECGYQNTASKKEYDFKMDIDAVEKTNVGNLT